MSNRSSGAVPVIIAGAGLAALVGGMLFFGGCTSQPSNGPETNPAQASPAPSASAAPQTGDASPSPSGPKETMVYVRVDDEDGSHLKPVPAAAEGGPKIDTPEAALNAMAKLENTPLPKGTEANSATVDNSGMARVDFNDAFKANFKGGDTGEALALNAVLQTMGQFGAKQVQITVGGKKIDSLGGMQSLDEPLPVPKDGKAPLTQSGEKE